MYCNWKLQTQIDKVQWSNQCEWYMNKSLCKNLQNIDRNKTVTFDVWSAAEVEKQTYFEKTTF